jgi:hypothetical protein
MELVVQIQDQYKALKLIEFLRAFDFVNVIQTNTFDEKLARQENTAEDVDFFAYAGLWANREITVETLRQQAWRQYSV